MFQPDRHTRVQEQNRITRSNTLILALALTALFAAQVDAQSERPLHFLTKQCNEEVIQVHLDSRPYQDLAGSDFSVVLEEGKARIQILVQDCSEYWIDGENLGPTQEIHVWLLIDGLKDVRPVVGAQQTRPTMTWLSLFDGSTNRQAREARMAAGSVQVPIESVSLDPPGPKRGGRVIFDRNLTYSWDVVPVVPQVRLVGVNHDVYTKDSAGSGKRFWQERSKISRPLGIFNQEDALTLFFGPVGEDIPARRIEERNHRFFAYLNHVYRPIPLVRVTALRV